MSISRSKKTSLGNKNSDASYLGRLKFDPQLYSSFIYKIISNTRLIFLAILTLVIAGTFSYLTLPRELNPEVKIPIVSVVTTLPGANPLDVEELITNEIEREVDNIPEVDRLTSSSSEGVSVVSIEFVSSADPDKVLDDVKEKVDLVTNLPEDASIPKVTKLDFNDQPVLQVALVGDVDEHSLSRIADEMKQQLEQLPQVRQVSLAGNEEEEIVVAVSQETLATYHLSADAITQAISGFDVTLPVGTILVNSTEYQLTVDNAFDRIEQLRNVPITIGGQELALGEVAEIYFQAKDTNSQARYSDHDRQDLQAVELSIYKSDNATISEAADLSFQTLEEKIKLYPQIEVVEVLDSSQEITDQFKELGNNFRDTVILVFLTLFIFLGFRQASIASLSIPLTFLSSFVIMQMVGITLNFLSLFSLLLALGLVVDDAIVIVQASYRYGKKFKPMEMGLLVFRDFVVPIWTTTLTTVWAFVPLLLATGIIGEFIKSIPVVVSATLLSSTTIAVLINLPLVVTFAKLQLPKRVKIALAVMIILLSIFVISLLTGASPLTPLVMVAWLLLLGITFWVRKDLLARFKKRVGGKVQQRANRWFKAGLVDFSQVADRYQRLLRKIVTKKKWRWSVYGVSVVFFVVSVLFLVTGLLKNEFFPKTDQEQLYVNIEGPAGWPVEKTLDVVNEVEDEILAFPEVKHILTKTNRNLDPSGMNLSGNSGPHLAYITVVLPAEEDRERSSIEIADEMRAMFSDYVKAQVTVAELSGGPPVGADLQVNISGSDLVKLEEVSNSFMSVLGQIEGAVNIDTSLKQNAGQIKVEFIPRELQERDLNPIQVALWLRTAVTGSDVGEIKFEDNDLAVVVHFDKDDLSLSRLQNLVLPMQGGTYTLAEVADLTLETSPTVVEHENRGRVVRVTAATSGVTAPELLASFEEKVSNYDLPDGVTWDVGGANEENQESTLSIIRAMGLSVILILITMVVQLNSFRKSFLVLIVIPLAVAGVFFNFTLLGVPLSFAALIGVLALFGIVVNNSIMLVEKINQNIKFGLGFYDAVVDACGSRIEAIFFTSLTTTMGLLPITISDPFWRGLGGAIIAGLSVSGILILFLLPTLYVELYQNSEENQFKRV